MGRAIGYGFTVAQRQELWDRYQRGESLKAIARALGKNSSSIYAHLKPTGGIRPAPRKRSMADRLDRAPSTISREIARNGGCRRYRAARADQRAWDRARRPKPCKLALDRRLARKVAAWLKMNWSPEQIAGWLKTEHPGDERYHVSHETIYQSLFIQARGALKKELTVHLRSQRTIRRSRHAKGKGEGQGQIKDMVSIRERPASVEDRALPGHWEGDLIAGSRQSYIATLVERKTRYLLLAKVKSRDTKTVIDALIRQAKKLPKELKKSLTWDQGKEFAGHQRFKLKTDIDVYFCDPASPWQRGSNENTNGLLRQYFPKGTDLSVHSQWHVNSTDDRERLWVFEHRHKNLASVLRRPSEITAEEDSVVEWRVAGLHPKPAAQLLNY